MDQFLFACPCCQFPTLSERGSYDICTICWWEDDGQDNETANQVWGGPNGPYSLARARTNFKRHGHMYDVGKGIDVVENPSRARKELLRYVDSVESAAKIELELLFRLLEKERLSR
ncbi:hypothetical protein DS901_12995 [Loktanella sp. D2R18]|uniref:CPCC family cysteine-rich protein n=1 Tax=Rhodobacterales TaxID=204455 RepID=UPI000DE8756B|nr:MULTISPECIES: CPCC family cysteine-rich protein [Rhodobacterales]MDO6591655.1 CPCC family cysteine-rich protein [Yoonia sp. 1_MG-2023]RBW42491.1 hypothetical protein DS901_12995 [Loktanella sp. D2R18]